MANRKFNSKKVIFTTLAAVALSFACATTANAEDIRVKNQVGIRVKSAGNEQGKSTVGIRVKGTENIRVKGTENIRVKGTENIRVKGSTNGDGNVFTDFLNRVFGVRV